LVNPALPKISFIIPTLNQAARLERCLHAIYRQEPHDFEVLVVNNGTTGRLTPLVQQFSGLQVLEMGKNVGFAAGCNCGIQTAQGSYIALINDDVRLHPSWLTNMLQAMDTNPGISSCASNLVYLDRLLVDFQSRSVSYLIDCQGDGYLASGFGYKRNWGDPLRNHQSAPEEVFGASAAAALYTREFFSDVGLFDDHFFCFCEDVDLSFRARLLGHRCLYVPGAIAYHSVRATAIENTDFTIFYSYRNFLAAWTKNMPGRLILRNLPFFLVHQILVFLRFLLFGPQKAYFRALRAYFQDLPKYLQSRREMIARRRTPAENNRLFLDVHWFVTPLRLRRGRKLLEKSMVTAIEDTLLDYPFPVTPDFYTAVAQRVPELEPDVHL